MEQQMIRTADQRRRTGRLLLICLTLLILVSAPVAAQELRASIRGVVSDSSGAVIPGATVTLINDNTAVEVTRQTNAVGDYVFDYVSAGTYTLRFESEGFRTFEQRNILVQTLGDITVNAVMELGAVAETVTVEETPVAVSFNRTTMETTLDTQMANSLPLINRNPFMLAQLDPAVNYTGGVENSPYHHWAASQMDVGGNTALKNDVLVDGSPQLVGAKSTYAPPMDAVSEVSVQQNAVDAEFGHSAGGIVSVQMKSGTNDFHGTAYYFGRNPKLNAVSDSTTHTPNTIKNHTWGATSQNPIVKNKVFNFFAYEGTNMRDARTQKYTLPTALERSGDFSQTWVKAGQMRTIYDPLTSAFDPDNNIAPRQPFAGNRIPQDRMDPTAARFLKDIWEPNNSNSITGANNYTATVPMVFKYWNISDRVDYNINDNVKVYGRYSQFHTDQTEANFVGSRALRKSGSTRNTLQVQGDLVWTISPTTVFNIRGMMSKINDSFNDDDAKIESYDEFWPGNDWYQSYMAELPALYYPGLDVRAATRSRFGRDGFWYQEPKTWNIQSKLSRQMGKHYLKVGGEFRQQRVKAQRPRPMGFRFERKHTADDGVSPETKTTGAAWATMLLGVVDDSSGNRIQVKPMNLPRTEFYGFYFQDDFKINKRFTLNLGLRWEYETALKDPQRRLSRLLDLTNPIPEFQGSGAPVLPPEVMAIRGSTPQWNGAWVFTDDDHPGAWDAPKNTVLPRIGLAIRINDRTALRVGYARYAVPSIQVKDGDIAILGSTPYPGFDNETRPLGPLEGIPRAFLDDPYPAGENPLIPAVGKSLGRYTRLGDSAFWFRPDFKLGVNERINISLQHQFWNRFVMDLTWFMNFGYNQANFLEGGEYLPNLMDPRFGFTHGAAIAQSVDNPFFGILTPETFPGPLRNTKKVKVSDLLTPYPQYKGMEQSPAGDVSNRYQALQLQVQRPFANGFNFLLGYNYNRSREQQYFDNQDRFDGMYSWYDGYKPRHKLTVAGIYEFPFGRGKRWGADWHPFLDGAFGGWSVSGILVHRSGWLMHFTGTDLVSGDPRIDNPTRERMWDTSVFAKQPAYTRRSNPHQFSGVRGPFYRNLDFTLQKMFQITEKVSFEFRFEAFNLTNSFMGANPSTSRTSSTFGQVVDQLRTHRGRDLQYSGRFRW